MHIIIPTHTTRHLRLTLLGAALQRPGADTITVSIDTDDPSVRACVQDCAREFDAHVLTVSRPYPGEVRVGQVRNNGVRTLLASCPTDPDDLLYFLDGDSVAPPGFLGRAAALAQGADLLVGGRICLTEAQTGAFSEDSLRRAHPPAEISSDQLADARARQRRYQWQARLKPFGFVKAHKPKILGASHGVRLGMYTRVNGYDESFLGAWREDDDFGRRVYAAGGRCRVAVTDLCVYHLWHPDNPRKRENFTELSAEPSAGSACREGLASPRPQAELVIERVRHADSGSPGPVQSHPLIHALHAAR